MGTGLAVSSAPAPCALFGVYRGLVDVDLLGALRAEAQMMRGCASESLVIEDRASEGRGGIPARAYFSAPGGPFQDVFYGAPWLSDIVGCATGRPCVPTSRRGTFNYYLRQGDHLALHRDVEGCDVALITCLQSRTTLSPVASGSLLLFPDCVERPLSYARRSEAAVPVDLKEGESLIMLGGLVPHCLRPLGPGQERIVSVLCFRFC